MKALILEGGAMRAGFVAGAVMALMDRGLSDFDTALAVSASVPTLAYFAAGQRNEMESVWRCELNTPKLVCYRNIPAASLALSVKRPILDIHYLVYEVFKHKYPLDIETLLRSGMDCHFAVTQVPEGTLMLLSPGDYDIYNMFEAALAVPGCFPGTVLMGSHEYLDGGTVNPLPAKSLYDKRPGKILAILSKPVDCEAEPPSFFERALFWRYFQRYDWMIDRLWEAGQAYNDEVAFLEELAAKIPAKAFIVCPSKTPPARFITRDRKKINQTIDMGYRQVAVLEDKIRGFLSEDVA